MSASITPQQPELLTSWKEIASYLGKGVRTVQRWEQQFGLPVRRPNEKAKGIVHATRQELDQWLSLQWSQRPKEFANADRVDTFYIDEVRASIQQWTELRNEHRMLVAGMRASLKSFRDECQILARHLTVTSPPPIGRMK
jgi:hypothetical protein